MPYPYKKDSSTCPTENLRRFTVATLTWWRGQCLYQPGPSQGWVGVWRSVGVVKYSASSTVFSVHLHCPETIIILGQSMITLKLKDL